MQNRYVYHIPCKMIVFYFKELVFCLAAITIPIIVGVFLLLILRDGNFY